MSLKGKFLECKIRTLNDVLANNAVYEEFEEFLTLLLLDGDTSLTPYSKTGMHECLHCELLTLEQRIKSQSYHP